MCEIRGNFVVHYGFWDKCIQLWPLKSEIPSLFDMKYQMLLISKYSLNAWLNDMELQEKLIIGLRSQDIVVDIETSDPQSLEQGNLLLARWDLQCTLDPCRIS